MSDMHRSRTRNVILLKDDVGRAKPTAYDLPDETHAYGRSEMPDMEGAREVTMHWAAHVPRPNPAPNQRDFVRINKVAAKSNVASAKDLAEFSRNNNIMMAPAGPSGLLPKIIPSDVHPGFSYGVKARPSTPIHQVVNGDYHCAEETRLDTLYRSRDGAGEGRKCIKVQLTKTAKTNIENARTAKLAENILEVNAGPWKMSKFKNVSSKLHLAPMGKSASTPAL
jgi:hypothetical protein